MHRPQTGESAGDRLEAIRGVREQGTDLAVGQEQSQELLAAGSVCTGMAMKNVGPAAPQATGAPSSVFASSAPGYFPTKNGEM